jgi:hypothetical protein
LLDGGFRINIIIKQLKLRLELPKPKRAPYNLRMVNQTTTKPVGLIRDLKTHVHGMCRAHPHRLPTYIAAMPIHSHARVQVHGNTNTKGLQPPP